MKINCDTRSDDYFGRKFAGRVMVVCDGVELRFVHEADDVEGYAIVSATDAHGQPMIRDDEFVTKRVEGTIELIGERR